MSEEKNKDKDFEEWWSVKEYNGRKDMIAKIGFISGDAEILINTSKTAAKIAWQESKRITEARVKRETAEKIFKIMDKREKAQERYKIAHRVGGKMPDWVLDTLDRTKKQIDKIKKEFNLEG